MILTNALEPQTIEMIVWLGIFIIALVIEFATAELISIWFSVSAVGAIFLAALKVDVIYQIIAFAVLSLILFILSYKIFRKKLKPKLKPTNVDAIIGEEILVTKTISIHQNGEGKIRGVTWTLVSQEEILEGEYAIIDSLQGNKIIVHKKGSK